jgi:hypothetical protein
MKIEIGKTYVTDNGIKVAIVATDYTISSGYNFIGTTFDCAERTYANYNEQGIVSYAWDDGKMNLVKELTRPFGFPETEKPYHGTPYYFPNMGPNGYTGYTWSEDAFDNWLLKNGLLYLDKEDAIQASEIIVNLFKDYNENRINKRDNGETWLLKNSG